MFQGKSGERIYVKICGITNEVDALAAVDAGADALGFNLVRQSKRYVDLETAAVWIEKLPREICKVAVLVNPSFEKAFRISRLPFVDALQLHGSESPEFCGRLAKAGIRFAKALPVGNEKSLVDVGDFFTDTVILDSATDGEFGGSGKVFPWGFARQFIQKHPDLKAILAGGLDSENVAEAIAQVCPFGVDVTTGVEISPGRKDHLKLRAFTRAVRGTAA